MCFSQDYDFIRIFFEHIFPYGQECFKFEAVVESVVGAMPSMQFRVLRSQGRLQTLRRKSVGKAVMFVAGNDGEGRKLRN